MKLNCSLLLIFLFAFFALFNTLSIKNAASKVSGAAKLDKKNSVKTVKSNGQECCVPAPSVYETVTDKDSKPKEK